MVKLYAFGDPYLVADDGVRHAGLTRHPKRFALFIYLLCDSHGRPHRRGDLIATFWPEADSARGRNALRQALFVIRAAVGKNTILADGSEGLMVNRDLVDCDALAFQRAIRAGRMEAALTLYTGDFLGGFSIQGSEDFDTWAEEQRITLRRMASSAAQDLAYAAEGRRELGCALHWWRKTLTLRPFDEAVLRRIMALLAGSGNRGEAMAEFERFRSYMSLALGMDVSGETLEFSKTVAICPPEEIRQWTPDRRNGAAPANNQDTPSSADHWRRLSDDAEVFPG